MFRSRGRHGGTALLLVLACCLIGIFLALALYEFRNGEEFEVNAKLLAELENKKIVEDRPNNAQPGDWPQWRGPHRDGVSDETALLADWPTEGPKVLWRADCGEGFSSVSVARGR